MADGRVVRPAPGGSGEAVARLDEPAMAALGLHLFGRERAGGLREALDAPRSRKRIPVAIEGGAFPGFDVMPGLVALEPNERERRLYE
jgi:hypothetical protein